MKNGILRLKDGKDITMLDEEGLVTLGYVDDNNQITEIKVKVVDSYNIQ
jgi:hypothetical protein